MTIIAGPTFYSPNLLRLQIFRTRYKIK